MKWFSGKRPERETRKWITRMRSIERRIVRQQRQLQREEQKMLKSIGDAMDKNDIAMARQLAKDVARNRRMVLMLQKLSGQVRGIKFKLEQAQTLQSLSGDLRDLVRTMYQINKSLKIPMLQGLLDGLGIEMEQFDVAMESIDDAFDIATFDEIDDEAADQILDEILATKAAKTTKSLPSIPSGSNATEIESSEEIKK